jgi:hypothetical protein
VVPLNRSATTTTTTTTKSTAADAISPRTASSPLARRPFSFPASAPRSTLPRPSSADSIEDDDIPSSWSDHSSWPRGELGSSTMEKSPLALRSMCADVVELRGDGWNGGKSAGAQREAVGRASFKRGGLGMRTAGASGDGIIDARTSAGGCGRGRCAGEFRKVRSRAGTAGRWTAVVITLGRDDEMARRDDEMARPKHAFVRVCGLRLRPFLLLAAGPTERPGTGTGAQSPVDGRCR